MDRLRLKFGRWLVAAAMVLVWSFVQSDAKAFGTVLGEYGTTYCTPNLAVVGVICRASAAEAIQAHVDWNNSQGPACPVTGSFNAEGDTTWSYYIASKNVPCATSAPSYALMNGTKSTGSACPEGSTLIAGTTTSCRCNSGWRPLAANACEPYSCVQGEKQYNPESVKTTQAAGTVVCVSGCKARGDIAYGYGSDFWSFAPYTYTGATCEGGGGGTGDINADGTDHDGTSGPPSPCPSGKCPGTVNGTSMCVPCETSSTSGDPSGTGTQSGDKTTTTTNPDGSVTKTTTSTSCNATGSCTTTTTITTTYPDGTDDETTTTEEEPIASFCEENPSSPLCKNSIWGGSCQGGFNCDGDAVQCAIAREQHSRNCLLFDPGISADYEQLTQKGELRPEGHPGNEGATVDVFGAGSGLFDDTSGTTCPVDVSVTVMGQTLAIPLSETCEPLGWMGRIAWAFALVHATFIFVRRL